MIGRFILTITLLLIGTLLRGQTNIIQHSERTIRLDFNLPEIVSEKTTIDGTEYSRLDFKGSVPLVEKGAPLIPFKIEHIAIPPGTKVKLQYEVLRQTERQQTQILPLILVSGIGEQSLIPKNKTVYNSPLPYPGTRVEISEPYEYRKMMVVDLKIYPVQYYPQDQRVQLLQKISIQLKFGGRPTAAGFAQFSNNEKSFLKRYLLNWEQAQGWTVSRARRMAKTPVNYDFSVGEWYKIPVKTEGIYRITGSFLSGQGMDISKIDPATIQMFNYGGMPLSYSTADPVPEDLNEIAIDVVDNDGDGVLDENDLIYFYGRGVDGWKLNPNQNPQQPWVNYHHLYATTNYYIFTFNQKAGKRINVENSIQQTNPFVVSSFTDQYHFEEDRENLLQSGSDWYWERFSGLSDQATLNFTLPQNIAPGNSKFVIRFKGGSKLFHEDDQNYRDTLDISINGQKVKDNFVISNFQREKLEILDIPLSGGSNELFITHHGNIEAAQVLLDFFQVYFPRPLIAENNFLKINYVVDSSPVEFRVSGLGGSGNRVWDITDFANVKEIKPLQNSNTTIYQDRADAPTPRQYIVYASAAVQDIQQISSIQNTPNLRDSQRKGKFVIILPDEFYDAAEPLETFRESQQPFPLQTERVRLSEIYREFSSCVEDVTAIRNFLKWAYNNWQDYPEFVLLLGDGSYDYKGINFPNYINRVPAFEIEGATQTELDSRESDQYYVAFSSTSLGQLLPTIALGRVVANSITDIETYIEKVVKYSKSYNINNEANGWQTTLTFVADDENPGVPGSEWFHLRDTESLINNYVPRKFDITKIYLVDYETQAGGLSQIKPGATEDLLNQINRGTLMINFFGHGNPDTWAHEQVLTRSRDLSLIQNVDRLPLWVAATCTWGKYDDPGRSSMSEEMIWLKNRGGVAVLSATRPVFASSNRAFVHAFYQELFNDASDVETSRIVGNALLGSLLGTTNYQKFRFFGDPTLKLADPLYQVEIISISPDTLKALSTVTVQARVTDQFGNPLPQFQGEAIIKVFDTKDNLTARNGSIQYTKQGGTFFKGRVSVINGELSGKFIVPKSIKYDSNPTGRISIYAWSESNGDATGFNDGLLVYGTESIVDREGPQIDVSFENQPDFFDGDYVSRQPTLVVQITDENGINLTREVGHRIEISLDGKSRKDVTDFFVYDKDSYQSGKLRYTLPALSPGQHTLTISAWDNVNNFSEQEVTFRTISVSELALEEVVNYPNPFSEDTHFTFQFQSPSGFGEVKIKIYTVSGRLIQELEGFARPGFNKIEWDGRDRDGDRLANGVYIYKIVIDDGERKVEKIEKLAVLR